VLPSIVFKYNYEKFALSNKGLYFVGPIKYHQALSRHFDSMANIISVSIKFQIVKTGICKMETFIKIDVHHLKRLAVTIRSNVLQMFYNNLQAICKRYQSLIMPDYERLG